jgi:hypothetical protein
MFVMLTLIKFFFSATSFYPGRETITDTVLSHLPSRIGPGNEHLVDINDGETDIESENDWFAEPPPMEPARKNLFQSIGSDACRSKYLTFILLL